jgi:hypothetical protein
MFSVIGKARPEAGGSPREVSMSDCYLSHFSTAGEDRRAASFLSSLPHWADKLMFLAWVFIAVRQGPNPWE